jgi:hypothetical protein
MRYDERERAMHSVRFVLILFLTSLCLAGEKDKGYFDCGIPLSGRGDGGLGVGDFLMS